MMKEKQSNEGNSDGLYSCKNKTLCNLESLKEQAFSAIMELTHEEQEELLKKVRELQSSSSRNFSTA